ncbi:MAG: hypothetical protein ACRDSL_20385 [Pseudonocardiaceae bacterium]
MFVGFVAIIVAVVPATVIIRGDGERPNDVSREPVLIAAAVAVVGFVVCRMLRSAASRRFVDVSLQRGQYEPYRSPAFPFTLVAWVLIVVAGSMAFATFNVSERAKGPSAEDPFRSHTFTDWLPALVILAAVVTVGAASYYSWDFRRRHEIPVLEAHGVVTFVAPPRQLSKTEAVRLRTWMWLRGTTIEGMFLAGALLPRLLPGAERPSEYETALGVAMLFGGPGMISFTLLLFMFVFVPTRRSAWDALRRPSSLLAIGVCAVGVILASNGQEVAGQLITNAALLLASVTCLNIMDRGAQPWLGLAFLTFSYFLGYLTAPGGPPSLPSGIAGWTVAVLALGYTAHQARSHWRTWYALVPPISMSR